MGKQFDEYVRTNPNESFGSAAVKSLHMMLPIEGQRYLWKGLRDVHPYVKALSVVGLTVLQSPIYSTAILSYSILEEMIK